MSDIDLEQPVSIEISAEDAAKTAKPEGDGAAPVKTVQTDDMASALADLKRQVEEGRERERMARESAARSEQAAREAAAARAKAEGEVQGSRLSTITNAIDATEAQGEKAERAYADAMAAGDYAAAAKAQRAMAAAEARLLTLRNGKGAIEEKIAAPDKTEGRVERPAPQRADPVEHLASQLTPKSAAWVRAHPEAARIWSKIRAAHDSAVELEGLEPESDEYFAYVERRSGLARDGAAETRQEPRQEQPRRPASVSAPVGSTTAATRTSGLNTTVTLSPNEREVARLSFPEMSSAEAERTYAANKLALIREGKMAG